MNGEGICDICGAINTDAFADCPHDNPNPAAVVDMALDRKRLIDQCKGMAVEMEYQMAELMRVRSLLTAIGVLASSGSQS